MPGIAATNPRGRTPDPSISEIVDTWKRCTSCELRFAPFKDFRLDKVTLIASASTIELGMSERGDLDRSFNASVAGNPAYFNGKLVRVEGFSQENTGVIAQYLFVEVSPISYAVSKTLESNLSPESRNIEQARNWLTFDVLQVTSDGQICLGIRTDFSAALGSKGKLDFLGGGILEANASDASKIAYSDAELPDIRSAIKAECLGETSYSAITATHPGEALAQQLKLEGSFSRSKLLGISYNFDHHTFALVVRVPLTVASNAIRPRIDCPEFESEPVFVEADPDVLLRCAQEGIYQGYKLPTHVRGCFERYATHLIDFGSL